MMWRATGSVLVVVSAVLIGRFLAQPYRGRVQGLQDWVAFLDRFKLELTFRQRSLVDAFEASATSHEQRTVAHHLQRMLRENGCLEEATETAMALDMRLGSEERQVIEKLIPPLASAPAKWQDEALTNGSREVTRILTQVRDECQRKARMLETLSTLAGLTAVLILL